MPQAPLTRPLSELDQVDWSQLHHAYGPADDVPDMLQALVSDSPAERNEAIDFLIGVLHHQYDFYPSTAEAVPFLLGIVHENKDSGTSAELIRYLASVFLAANFRRDETKNLGYRWEGRPEPTTEELAAAKAIAEAAIATMALLPEAKSLIENLVSVLPSAAGAALHFAALSINKQPERELLAYALAQRDNEKPAYLSALENFYLDFPPSETDLPELIEKIQQIFESERSLQIKWALSEILQRITLLSNHKKGSDLIQPAVLKFWREIYLDPTPLQDAARQQLDQEVREKFGYAGVDDFLTHKEDWADTHRGAVTSLAFLDADNAIKAGALRGLSADPSYIADLLPQLLDDIPRLNPMASTLVVEILEALPVHEYAPNAPVAQLMDEFVRRMAEPENMTSDWRRIGTEEVLATWTKLSTIAPPTFLNPQ